ncbi:MAG: hypothetical protein OES79_04330 [Planctomycetota bacterium]|nr:hypothetical protein [Planctomycetota bacterium]
MDVGTLTFALLLIAISAGLVIAHVYAWRGERSRQEAESGQDCDFAWRKFRRRMQASLMIGVTGLAIMAGNWLPADPLVHLVYWAGVILWVVWIALLALADGLATQHHFRRLRNEQLVEEAQLRRQLQQHQHKGNGHARTPSDKTTSAG